VDLRIRALQVAIRISFNRRSASLFSHQRGPLLGDPSFFASNQNGYQSLEIEWIKAIEYRQDLHRDLCALVSDPAKSVHLYMWFFERRFALSGARANGHLSDEHLGLATASHGLRAAAPFPAALPLTEIEFAHAQRRRAEFITAKKRILELTWIKPMSKHFQGRCSESGPCVPDYRS
jgi:hypothetical protein